MTKDEIGDLIEALPQGLEPDELIYRLVNWAVDREREACAKFADQYMRDSEGKSFGVGNAIRARGQA
jgi:hypothetical protein